LDISERTAEKHVQNILSRLGLRSRTQAAAWAVQHEVGADVKGLTGPPN
jgi:DNA-binding NarL/FixJ family response regulator